LLYLKNKVFKNYWYETGKTEFLFKLLKTKNYELPYLNKYKFDLEYKYRSTNVSNRVFNNKRSKNNRIGRDVSSGLSK
jgi:hypothetical protein